MDRPAPLYEREQLVAMVDRLHSQRYAVVIGRRYGFTGSIKPEGRYYHWRYTVIDQNGKRNTTGERYLRGVDLESLSPEIMQTLAALAKTPYQKRNPRPKTHRRLLHEKFDRIKELTMHAPDQIQDSAQTSLDGLITALEEQTKR